MDEEEALSMERELDWLLKEQVHHDLAEVQSTLNECSGRFPFRLGLDDASNITKPQRLLLSCPNGAGNIKCVVTLFGDSICDADINFKHKLGKDHHMFKTSIQPDVHWKLQQIQDSANHLCCSISILSAIDSSHTFTSAKEVILLIDKLMKSLNLGRSCLAFPKRKSIEELIKNTNMQTLNPPVPNDVALSFYIHAAKLILAIYSLHTSNQQLEITSRNQVECTVQWLNEAVILFTLALQQCQQLRDKLMVLQQYEGGS